MLPTRKAFVVPPALDTPVGINPISMAPFMQSGAIMTPKPHHVFNLEGLDEIEALIVGRLNILVHRLYSTDNSADFMELADKIRELGYSESTRKTKHAKHVVEFMNTELEASYGLGYLRAFEFIPIQPKTAFKMGLKMGSSVGNDRWITVEHSYATRLKADRFSVELPPNGIYRNGTLYHKSFYYHELGAKDIIGLTKHERRAYDLDGMMGISATILVTEIHGELHESTR